MKILAISVFEPTKAAEAAKVLDKVLLPPIHRDTKL